MNNQGQSQNNDATMLAQELMNRVSELELALANKGVELAKEKNKVKELTEKNIALENKSKEGKK